MSTRIMTLFGEEIVPEPQKPVAKTRAKKGDDTSADDIADETEIPADPQAQPIENVGQPGNSADRVSAPPEVTSIVEMPAVQESRNVALAEESIPTTEEETPEETLEETAEPANIIPEDWHGEKQYYTIGEVAEFFKVKTSHIRFWTNEFKLKVRTTRKGDRLFTPDQVKELRAIYYLVKGRGFTLSGAKAKLKTQNKRDVTTVDLRTSLIHLKDKLVILRDQLV